MSKKNRKPIHGHGINDADYVIEKKSNGKTVWRCPFYSVWKQMITRCYSADYKRQKPTYEGVTCCEEWLLFSNFRRWMAQQDYEGKELDKDIIKHGNKVYCPEFCAFVTKATNLFVTHGDGSGNKIGVTGVSFDRKFRVKISNPITGIRETVGRFDSPDIAYMAWAERKSEIAREVAAMQTDSRVRDAILNRYCSD